MKSRLLSLPVALLLALGAAPGAHAQNKGNDDRVEIPVWNKASGKVEAVLVLEPTDAAQAGIRARFGGNYLDAAFGLSAGDSLGVLCDRKTGLASALSNLSDNCVLASVPDDLGSRRATATAAFGRGNSRAGVTLGSARDTLPVWLTPGATASTKVDINDLTIFGRKNLPREGYVSIAGTVAKARLLSPSEATSFLSDGWTSKTLTVGGGFGAFGANIVGHVVDTPGQPKWEGLGLGLTWRTPWSGQLTVGADNLVTRGKNPFAPAAAQGEEDEGTVPYVRYEQDL